MPDILQRQFYDVRVFPAADLYVEASSRTFRFLIGDLQAGHGQDAAAGLDAHDGGDVQVEVLRGSVVELDLQTQVEGAAVRRAARLVCDFLAVMEVGDAEGADAGHH